MIARFSFAVVLALIIADCPLHAQATLAVSGVSIVDTTGGPIQPDMTVLVHGERITAIGRRMVVSVPKNAAVIDGKGKFLIPGLWDMHVHVTTTSDLAAPLMVSLGVTGARDMGGDLAIVDWLRERINTRAIRGPQLFRPGPFVDSRKAGTPNRLEISTPDDARQAVHFLQERGVDFVKVHNGAPKAAYFALLEEAQKLGIPVAGHLPLDVDPLEAINQGHASLEHIVCLVEGPVTQMMKEGKTQDQAFAAIKDADLRILAKRMVARRTWFDPTLVAYYKRSYQWEPAIKDDANHLYAAGMLKQAWRAGRELPDRPDIRSRLAAGWKQFVHMARIMREEGVPFLVGTDAGAKFVVPGFDVHEELRILTDEVGLTPLQALQAATINPARSLGKDRELGTIERGKIADMVLLDGNPLTMITNTRLIAAVILRGMVMNQRELQELLTRIKTDADRY